MPSKHRQFRSPKPQPAVHPSLGPSPSPASSRSRASSHASEPSKSTVPSVNDLISHLRRTQISASATIRGSALTPSPRSVHPSLRNILDVPETPPPDPHLRSRRRSVGHVIAGRSRSVPGPAAPRSWLTPRDRRDSGLQQIHPDRNSGERCAVRRRSRLKRLPGAAFPGEGTLMHTVLKRMARRWDYHLLYDNVFLAELPDSLKQLLLSYVAYYTPHDDIEVGLKGLKPLFLDVSADCGQFLDQSAVSRLDLGNALGRWINLRQLARELKGWTDDPRTKLPAIEQTRHEPTPVSWEDEVDSPLPPRVPTPSGILKQPTLLRFPSLTYLSLASPHGNQAASWSSLLSLLPHLSKLTHLSLAYWPAPTLTPNAIRTRMRHPTAASISYQYGGTDIYSAYEGDWSEAASVLKRMSKATYCLKWLDLEGCMDWVDALTYGYSGTFTPISDSESSGNEGGADSDELGLVVKNGRAGPEWNGSWRMLEYLRLGVGWTPRDETWATTEIEKVALTQARSRCAGLQRRAEAAGKRILDIRRQGKGRWVHISHGERDEEDDIMDQS